MSNALLSRFASAWHTPLLAQEIHSSFLWQQPGVLITLVLILLPLLLMVALLMLRIVRGVNRLQQGTQPSHNGSHGNITEAGEHDHFNGSLLHGVHHARGPQFVARKKTSEPRPKTDPALARLVLGYLVCATVWLVLGTTAGEYLGLKFVRPEFDSWSWLSFGRLRPVHTNAVFWGWASLAMLGLAYYVVPTVSNAPLRGYRSAWAALVLINASVVLGSICLMAGINNAGGEYREYIWPVMLLFGIGLVLSLRNFIDVIARRKTGEIYISGWYIVSAILFVLIISIIAYWPTWQDGLGETIVQGYYMHQGVGMWFMLFNLGLVYYFLPQQLNKPIYSYSLGVLAFWAQIVFYTLIGTHHFVFSAIPWWLQTVAIIGSMGMLIPVLAGTTNFLMTFRGAWTKVASSYTLPFYLVGIVFYFTGSVQGTAEAFRFTNLVWHFTDFTTAHSHITMYGIITFLLWGSIYAITPRLTGNEPSQLLTGAHFWLAFLGLMFYTIPLMIGGTLRGLSWMEGKPFIDSVVQMAPYWLWRAIGGSFMWLSHLVFAVNLYGMMRPARHERDEKAAAFEKLHAATVNEFLSDPSIR